LLQGAAVVGKVFWAGALAEMANQDQGEVQAALRDLARKELVRPAPCPGNRKRTSSPSSWFRFSADHMYYGISPLRSAMSSPEFGGLSCARFGGVRAAVQGRPRLSGGTGDQAQQPQLNPAGGPRAARK
jgi:hypothetical protein